MCEVPFYVRLFWVIMLMLPYTMFVILLTIRNLRIHLEHELIHGLQLTGALIDARRQLENELTVSSKQIYEQEIPGNNDRE